MTESNSASMSPPCSGGPRFREPAAGSGKRLRNGRIAGLLVFALGLGMGLAFGFFALGHLPEACTDVDGFGALGEKFARTWGFGGSVRRAPIYPLFLGLLYRAFGIGNHAAVVSAQAVVFAVLCLSIQRLSLLLFHSRRMAIATGLCAVLHPVLWWYVPRLWVELPYALLALWSTHAAIRAAERPTMFRMAVFGMSAAAASLCKATSMLLPLFLGLAVAGGWMARSRAFAHLGIRSVVRFVLVPTISMCLCLAPWTLRNWRVAGRFVPVSGHLPVEFFRGTAFADQNSFLLKKGIAELWTESEKRETAFIAAVGAGPGAELDELFARPMRQLMFRTPHRFAVKILKQIPAFWSLGDSLPKSSFFLCNAVLLLALGGRGLWRRRTEPASVLVFFTVVYFNLCYAAILAYARYSVVLYPLLLLYAVPGLVSLFPESLGGTADGRKESRRN